MFSDEIAHLQEKERKMIAGNFLILIQVMPSHLIPIMSLFCILERNEIIVEYMFLSHSSVLLNRSGELNLSVSPGRA